MTDDVEVTFEEMARTFPLRTGVYTVGPLLVGLAQVVNSYLHGVSLVYACVLAGLLVAYSVYITRYHLASFRVSRLTEQWLQGPSTDAAPDR